MRGRGVFYSVRTKIADSTLYRWIPCLEGNEDFKRPCLTAVISRQIGNPENEKSIKDNNLSEEDRLIGTYNKNSPIPQLFQNFLS